MAVLKTRAAAGNYDLKFVRQAADEFDVVLLAAGRGLVDVIVLQESLQAQVCL